MSRFKGELILTVAAGVIGKWSLQAEFVKRGGLDNDPAGVEGAIIDHQ
jgi:hypothetical protein